MHLKLVINKARGAFSRIYSLHLKKMGVNTKTKLTLYKTLV